jgi:hypothetical protein
MSKTNPIGLKRTPAAIALNLSGCEISMPELEPRRIENTHVASGNQPVPVREPPILWADASRDRRQAANVFESLERAFGGKAYGAPRVFDLFTLLAVTLAFALLFGAIRLIEPLLLLNTGEVIAWISFFLTGIAIAQLLLWSGKMPRLASVLAGPLLFLSIGVAIALAQRAPWQFAFGTMLCSIPFGVFAGYLGGAVVAGVFLLADAFRKRFLVNDGKLGGDVDFDKID